MTMTSCLGLGIGVQASGDGSMTRANISARWAVEAVAHHSGSSGHSGQAQWQWTGVALKSVDSSPTHYTLHW